MKNHTDFTCTDSTVLKEVQEMQFQIWYTHSIIQLVFHIYDHSTQKNKQGLLTGEIEEWLRNGRCHCFTIVTIRPQTSAHSLSFLTAVLCKNKQKKTCVHVCVCPNVTIPVPCTEEPFVFQSQSVKARGCWKEHKVEKKKEWRWDTRKRLGVDYSHINPLIQYILYHIA